MKQLAITVDDISIFEASPEAREASLRHLIERLVACGAPAMGFVVSNSLEDEHGNPTATHRGVCRWVEAGLRLGNHTHSHEDLGTVGVDAFLSSVERCQEALLSLPVPRRAISSYVRFPYLNTGLDSEQRDHVRRGLVSRGLQPVPVSLGLHAWRFELLYGEAVHAGEHDRAKDLQRAFMRYALEELSWAEELGRRRWGRHSPQILLAHCSLLTAHTITDLVGQLRARGYTIVPLESLVRGPDYASRAGEGALSPWSMFTAPQEAEETQRRWPAPAELLRATEDAHWRWRETVCGESRDA